MKQFFVFRRIVLITFAVIMVVAIGMFATVVVDQLEALLSGHDRTLFMGLQADFTILVAFTAGTIGAVIGFVVYVGSACQSYKEYREEANTWKVANSIWEGTGHD